MTPLRIALSLVLGTGFVLAQDGNRPEIRGIVTDLEENAGLSGAEITLFEFLEDSHGLVVRTPVATTSTNTPGEFHFPLQHYGNYYLEARKDTYVASIAGLGKPTESAGTPADVDADHPIDEVRFSLMRPGEIGGRVIDGQGNPISNVGISVQNSETGLPFGMPPNAVTDNEGAFVVKGTPGQHWVQAAHRHGDFETVIGRFSQDDLKVVDQDIESSTPALVSAGGGTTSNAGTITVHMMTYYRAHISVTNPSCGPNDALVFSDVPKGRSFSLHSIGLPCGREFLIGNLRPGSYRFTIQRGNLGGSGKEAMTEVKIKDENVEVSLAAPTQ